MQYLERQWESLDWITLMMVGCLILLALAKYFYPKRFQEFVMLALTNKYFLVQGKNDEIRHPFNVLLFGIQIISVSLFIYLLIKTYNPNLTANNSWLFIQICTAYSVFVLVKFSIEKLIGAIFSIESLVNGYLYQKLSYRNWLAMVFFLGNLVFYYAFKPTINILIVFLGVVILFNLVALFYSYKSNRNLILSHYFYFILYLCALEISPYLILYKVLI